MPDDRRIPTPHNPDLATFTILIDEEELSGRYEVLSLSVRKEINRLPAAEIVLKDGDPAGGDFPASNEELFLPGKAVQIQAGYHGEEEKIFEGIVVKHNIRIRQGSSRLYVSCKDKAFRMTLERKSRYFEAVSDSDVLETIIGEYNLPSEVEHTDYQHLELIQYQSTDWDFLLNRADVNGMLCLVDDGTFTVKRPEVTGDPVLSLTYGATILEMDAEIDGRLQHERIKSLAWDPANQEIQEVEAQEPDVPAQGNLEATTIGSDLNVPPDTLFHSGKLQSEELQAWADAKILKGRMAKIKGRVRFQGFAGVKPGHLIELAGVGDRFSGTAYVSGILHQLAEGNWITNAQFGLDDQWFAARFDVSAAAASLLLPAVRGLQIGIVTELEGDPEGEERIRIRLPLIDPQGEGSWARQATLDAGNRRGSFFRPEVDDEVIVGFINDDPRDMVILGMLHSSAHPNPEAISENNFKKGYLSREGLRIEFDDEDKKITLETPGGNKMILDDATGGILVEDQNGNKIEMSSNGIMMESASTLEYQAGTDFKMEGMNVNLTAQASLKAEGNASSEISSGGVTTVKGSLVQIN